jgi:hypothetical protein
VVTKPSGTRIFFSGLLDEVYQRLNNWYEVSRYLQDVVPLPFSGDFRYKDTLEQTLTEAAEKIVRLTLTVGDRAGELFRPYYDGMFSHGGTYEPKTFPIEPFGFAWVCINDSRSVLPAKELRGLLIKKFGFSVANRAFLEPFFPRVVFNRRITGELIIHNHKLIPNAARSDFEHNATRETFLRSLPKLIASISKWANEIQEEERAKEVLSDVLCSVSDINRSLPERRRNPDEMLNLNVRLSILKDMLRIHERRLERTQPDRLQATRNLLSECTSFVNAELSASRSKKASVESRIAKSVVAAAKAETEEAKVEEEKADSLLTMLETFGVNMGEDIKDVLRFIDENVLKEHLNDAEYQESLKQLRDYLGEQL